MLYQSIITNQLIWLDICLQRLAMTPQEQAHEFLSKRFTSRNTLFEFNFYFTTESRGLMEVVYLLKDQVEFFRFDIDYTDLQTRIRLYDVETSTSEEESVVGINMLLGEAVYYLTHKVEKLWRFDPKNAIY